MTAVWYEDKRKREVVEKPFTIDDEVLREIVRMGRQKEFLSTPLTREMVDDITVSGSLISRTREKEQQEKRLVEFAIGKASEVHL